MLFSDDLTSSRVLRGLEQAADTQYVGGFSLFLRQEYDRNHEEHFGQL